MLHAFCDFFLSPPFCPTPVLFFSIVSSLYFSLVFVESCCYVCIVFSCFIKGGDRRPLPQMKQKWKAGRGLKRSVLFIREVYSGLCRFHSRKFEMLVWRRSVRETQSCNQSVGLAALGVLTPKGHRGENMFNFISTCLKSVFNCKLQI